MKTLTFKKEYDNFNDAAKALAVDNQKDFVSHFGIGSNILVDNYLYSATMQESPKKGSFCFTCSVVLTLTAVEDER